MFNKLVILTLLIVLYISTVYSNYSNPKFDNVDQTEFLNMMNKADAIDRMAFTIGSSNMTEVTDPKKINFEAIQNFYKKAETHRQYAKTESDSEGVDVAFVINTAKQVWTFIEDKKAVSNVESYYGNVLPQGVANAFSLSGWSSPTSRSYSITLKNLLGITVVDLQYTVSFIPRGSYKGVGKYLDHVTIIPTKVFVNWGYSLNAQVKITSITNRGSDSAPVAAATVQLYYKVSALNSFEKTESFYVTGDNQFQWITRV